MYDIMTAFEWAKANEATEPPAEFYCKTSDVWQGRLSKTDAELVRRGFNVEVARLFTAAIGEVGDNCFAHNSPGWVDIPGCWFEQVNDKNSIHYIIADRGRGIFMSLRTVKPSLQSYKEALLTALTERITGRAPENRGNGLKFVMSVLAQLKHGSFSLQSGSAKFDCIMPLDTEKIAEYITDVSEEIRGTYCEIKVTF